MNWENLLLAATSAILEIQRRHAIDHPDAPPLTDEEVHAQLLDKVRDATSNINAFFVEHGLPLPV